MRQGTCTCSAHACVRVAWRKGKGCTNTGTVCFVCCGIDSALGLHAAVLREQLDCRLGHRHLVLCGFHVSGVCHYSATAWCLTKLCKMLVCSCVSVGVWHLCLLVLVSGILVFVSGVSVAFIPSAGVWHY